MKEKKRKKKPDRSKVNPEKKEQEKAELKSGVDT